MTNQNKHLRAFLKICIFFPTVTKLYLDYVDYCECNILIRQVPRQWQIKTNIWEHFWIFKFFFSHSNKLYFDDFDYFECNILIRQVPWQSQITINIWEHFWKFVFKIFFPTVTKSLLFFKSMVFKRNFMDQKQP